MNKRINILLVLLCTAVMEAGCYAGPRHTNAPSEAHAKKMQFTLVRRKPQSIVWVFQIKNNTSAPIELDSMFSPEFPYASASDHWQFFKDGKWQDIIEQNDTQHYSYFLKPGKSVKFLAAIVVSIRDLRLSRHTLVRLKNGAYYSEPFELQDRAIEKDMP